MNKKVVKIGIVLFMAMFMVVSIAMNSFALQPSDITAKSQISGSGEIQNVGQSIVGILQVVGIILSVIVLIILGIKYMMGSAEEKAEYKKTMMPYIVGAALIFAASSLAQVVYQFFIGITSGTAAQ